MIAKLGDDLADLNATLERRGDDFAWSAVRQFGEALCTLGGGDLMKRVLDRAIDRHGPTLRPVLDVWHGIEGWQGA